MSNVKKVPGAFSALGIPIVAYECFYVHGNFDLRVECNLGDLSG